jgi:glycosyltransferase involved in cell wall biosynthesis
MGKKIVIDAREWSGSTGRYIRNLVRQLEKLATEDDYTVLMKPRDLAAWEPTRPNFRKLVCPWQEFTFGEQLGFWRQLNGLKPDLVHFGKDHQPVFYGGKVVTTMHDLTTTRFYNPAKLWPVFKFKQLVYRWLVKRVARKSAAILTGSQFVKDNLIEFTGVDPDKITVTYEAADVIKDRPEPVKGLEDKRFIMYIGRPTPHKNLKRLVEAFGLLQSRHPSLVLVLAGKQDANYRRLEALARKRGVKGVVFSGFVNEGQLRWLYEHCTAYVFPSLSEGFGLPGLEAMAHGALVVSSSATCLPEVYGNAAHYFDPLDVQAMADAINEVLTDKALRAELGKKGHTQAVKYSWQHMAEQTLKVYASVLDDIN